MPEPAIERLTDFIYEMGLLKRYRRAGWLVAGVGEAESIAEHAFRTAIIGYLLALLEGADCARTALLCLFHDSQETRVGDVPLIGRRYVTTAANPEVTADQVAGFPAKIGRAVRDLVDEYEADASPEARLAATPTSWSAWSRHASTRKPTATRTCGSGSSPPPRRCGPAPPWSWPKPAGGSPRAAGGRRLGRRPCGTTPPPGRTGSRASGTARPRDLAEAPGDRGGRPACQGTVEAVE
jgi:5'-deoxynucleotidase YfbR-like HD superfamily hydrolase